MSDSLELVLREHTGVPLYRQIVDQVADRIMSRRLKPGVRIPSVRELAAQLRVSVITTRRAYAELEAAGLVSCEHGNGTFVAERPRAAASRLLRIEAMQRLEVAVERSLQIGVRPAEIRRQVDEMLAQSDLSNAR